MEEAQGLTPRAAVGTLRFRLPGGIRAMDASPDGALLAVVGYDGGALLDALVEAGAPKKKKPCPE